MGLEDTFKSYVLNTYPRSYTNFVRGENATLYDDNIKDYIDFTSGVGVVSVGHANNRLSNAINEQSKNIIHISNLYAIEPQALLAKKISKLYKKDVATFFANSGAEANEGAIKLARKYGRGNRYKIITLNNSFHGRTITTLKANGQSIFHKDFAPFPDGFVYADNIDDIYNKIDNQTVAVMIELIQGEGGVEVLNKSSVKKLQNNLKNKDILLIIDEVQTGIYRTGKFLASNLYEIDPDIITLAKGLGGGVPIGAVVTKLKDLFEVGDHGSTFGGNFLCTRAGLEVLKILSSKNDLNENVKYFDKGLNAIYKEFDIFDDIVGIGFMRGLRVKSSIDIANIIDIAKKEGVLILKSGLNTLRFLPPLTITKQEINKGFNRFKNALKSL